ncbi:unnamed protein product [Calypogeia fissa]
MGDSILPSIFSVWKKLQEKVSSAASSSTPLDVPKLNQLSDMVYEVYTPPEDRPELEIVFFHGLQLGSSKDAYVTTWMSCDNSHLWIQTWLVELFPRARILTVSYDSSAEKTQESGVMDMYCTTENLVSSLIADEVRVGQRGCPVVFVGHCLGGLVLKEVCLSAAWMMGRKSEKIPRMERIRHLLSNIRGMFYYGTPHVGFNDELHNYFEGALLQEMVNLRVSSARRNHHFDELRLMYGWITSGVGETRETYVEFLETHIRFVTDVSSRQSMDFYYSANSDHYDICKAEWRHSAALYRLEDFLKTVRQAKKRDQLEYFIDLDGRVEQVRSMLDQADLHTIFIVGLSGIGKTSLARQVYDEIGDSFDVKCFVSLDSIEGQSNSSDQVWRKIREELDGIFASHLQNLPTILYQMWNRRILLVLDNVESKSQLDILRTEDWLEGSLSKLIVTSTTSQFSIAANTFEVGNLRLEESEQLFRHCAFQDGEGPRDLGDLIQHVIVKCDGYPLLIKTLAGFVSKESDAIDHKQVWLNLSSRLLKAEDVDTGPDYRFWAKFKGIMESLALELEVTDLTRFQLTYHNYDRLQYLILKGGTTSSGTLWWKLPPSLVYLRWKDGSFVVCPVDFTGLENLVILELLDCKFMRSLPPSIGNVNKLTWLELEGCSSLSELPLGLPKYLKYIGLERTGLQRQPNDFRNSNEDGPSRVRDSLEDLCNDPITMDIMCDPVKCNDGRTYCRWTIVNNSIMNTSPYVRNMKLAISCDDITLRSLLFSVFPEQEFKFRERRNQHRKEALQHARADPVELEDAIEKLSNVLKWDPRDMECETELAKVLDLVEHQHLSLLDTIPVVRHEDVMALLDTIPEVRHEDVIGARIDNEGGRFFAFLLLGYITIWNTLVKIGNDHHVFSEASPTGSFWLARRAS